MEPGDTPSVIEIGLVEDQAETVQTIIDSVRCDRSIHIQFVAHSVAAARQALEQHRPDILLVDLGLPDGSGLQVIESAVRRSPKTDVMVFSMFGDERSVLSSIHAGACGYILKDSPGLSLGAAIGLIRTGGVPMSPIIARQILGLLRSNDVAATPAKAVRDPTAASSASTKPAAFAAIGTAAKASAPPGAAFASGTTPGPIAPPAAADGDPAPKLSSREIQVLELVARGYTYGEVSDLMQVSVNTIRTHVRNLYFKLSVHSGREAIFEARRLGLLHSPSTR